VRSSADRLSYVSKSSSLIYLFLSYGESTTAVKKRSGNCHAPEKYREVFFNSLTFLYWHRVCPFHHGPSVAAGSNKVVVLKSTCIISARKSFIHSFSTCGYKKR